MIDLSQTSSVSAKVPPYFSDVVSLRVKKWSFGKSKAGNEQFTLETEIVAPSEVESDGSKYALAGQEITFYLGVSDKKAEGAKQSPLAALKEFHTKLGLPLSVDPENPPYEGLVFEYLATSQEDKMKRRNRDGSWEILKDAQGKDRVNGWVWSNFLGNVVGPSSWSAENPY